MRWRHEYNLDRNYRNDTDWQTSAISLHKNGLNDYEIAEQLGVSRSRVIYWRQKNGLSPNMHHRLTITHGAYTRDKRLAAVWKKIIRRCEDPADALYHRYGGRGIAVCEEWHDPHSFFDWAIKNRYEHGLHVDRRDNDKGYSPENCRITTPKMNNRNKRTNRLVAINSETHCVAEWAEIIGANGRTVSKWFARYGEDKAIERIKEALLNG